MKKGAEFSLPTNKAVINPPPLFYSQAEIENIEARAKNGIDSFSVEETPSSNPSSVQDSRIQYSNTKPFELPVFRRRVPDSNSGTFSQSMMVCTNPNCTTCPPEFHAKMKSYRKHYTSSITSGEPKKSLKQDLEDIFDSDEEKEEDTSRKSGFRLTDFCLLISEFFRLPVEFSTLILSPHSTFVLNWNKFFVCTCLLSFFVDPLFFFSLYFDESHGCLSIYWKCVIILTIIRSMTDLVYFIHIAFQFRIAYVAGPRRRLWWGGYQTDPVPPGETVTNFKDIAKNYLKGFFIFDLLAALPLPQVIFLGIVPSVQDYVTKGLLRISILIQTVPRIMRFYSLIAGTTHSRGFVFESASANFMLNLVLFFIVSHFFGAMWFLLSIQRMRECLLKVCENSSFQPCIKSYLDCGLYNRHKKNYDWFEKFDVNSKCFPDVNSSNGISDYVNFGIYKLAIPYLKEEAFMSKYIYSLYWGFQQISTLAGNQQPSPNAWEAAFLFCITALGLLLFALLIGNIQSFLQALGRRAFDYQIHRMDMEEWTTRRNFPLPLKRRIQDLEKLQWTLTRGVNETELINSLTEDLRRDVRKFLCMDLLTKSELFSAMDEQVQDAICERLQPRGYVQGTVIIKENSPVQRMFFVLKGELEGISPKRGRTGMYNVSTLSKGDFFGEELFVAFIENEQTSKSSRKRIFEHLGSLSNKKIEDLEKEKEKGVSSYEILPKSERTIVCVRAVEGFVLEALDLEYICKQFRLHMLSKKVQVALNKCSHSRREKSAITIQLAWRAYWRKKLNLTIEEMEARTRKTRLASIFQAATKMRKQNYEKVN